MAFKRFIVGMAAFFLTTGVFSWVGSMFSNPWLLFDYEYTDKRVFISVGPFVPILIGFIVSVFAEKF